MAPYEYGPTSDEDDEKKKTYSYMDLQREAEDSTPDSILDWSLETDKEEDKNWFDKLFDTVETEDIEVIEAPVTEVAENHALPTTIEMPVEPEAEELVEAEPVDDELESVVTESSLAEDNTEQSTAEMEADFAEVVETLAAEKEETEELEDTTVSIPLPPIVTPVVKLETETADLEEEDSISELVADAKDEVNHDEVELQPTPELEQPESEKISENLDYLKTVMVKLEHAALSAGELVESSDTRTEDPEKDAVDIEQTVDLAVTRIVSKLDRQVKRLDALARQNEKAEAADIQKNVIAVSEKLAAMPNKLQQQKMMHLRNLMEVLGFEQVNQSLELMLKQYGEQFVDQLISQMLQLLREEKIEMRGTPTKTQLKLLKNLRSKALGRFILGFLGSSPK
ncbi:hypothetical protein KBC79_05520 [Candidatus Woesebacteria bacterium]|nr:hypothetical protein [Candidatus Woesebacteria bacterium]